MKEFTYLNPVTCCKKSSSQRNLNCLVLQERNFPDHLLTLNHGALDKNVVTSVCFRIFSRTETIRTVCRWVFVWRMAKHYRRPGLSRNLSMGNILVSIVIGCRFLNHRYAKVKQFPLITSYARRISVTQSNRYKLIIILSAGVGIALWSLLLWTTSIEAIIVRVFIVCLSLVH